MDESFIIEKLKVLRKRFRKLLLFERVTGFLLWGTSATAIILIIMKIFGCDAPLTYYSLIPSALAVAIPLVMYVLQKIPLIRVALICDDRLQLKERLSTVLEWVEQNKKRTLMFKGLINDAALNAKKIIPEKLFPYRFPARARAIGLTIPVICLLIATPPWGIVRHIFSKDEVKNIRTAAQKIEKKAAELEKNRIIRPVVKKDIQRRADEIKKLVKNPNNVDKKKAIARISDLKDRLREERRELNRNRSLLEKLGDTRSRNQERSGANQNGRQAAWEKMKDMAAKLKKENLSKNDLKKIEAELSRMNAQLPSESALKKDLEKALQQMAQGNTEMASQSLNEAAQKMQQMESECAGEKELDNMAGDLENLKNAMAGNGEMTSDAGSGEENPEETGETGSAFNTAAHTAGGSVTEASSQSGKYKETNEKKPADFGVGTTNKEAKENGQSSPDYVLKRQSNSESHWKEFYEKVYKSERHKLGSADTHVKGKLTGPQGAYIKDDIKGGIPVAGLHRGGPREVYSAYKGKAEEAITKETIPGQYKTLVKDYFNEIDPSK